MDPGFFLVLDSAEWSFRALNVFRIRMFLSLVFSIFTYLLSLFLFWTRSTGSSNNTPQDEENGNMAYEVFSVSLKFDSGLIFALIGGSRAWRVP